MKVILDEQEYEVIKDYKDAFNKEDLTNLYTPYFKDYDYILGDYAYSKLRLKGFCNKENSMLNNINDYENIDDYIKNECAYECKYFVIKKIEK
jgi:uncharacterized protein YutD